MTPGRIMKRRTSLAGVPRVFVTTPIVWPALPGRGIAPGQKNGEGSVTRQIRSPVRAE
jgi:hypothetical protein